MTKVPLLDDDLNLVPSYKVWSAWLLGDNLGFVVEFQVIREYKEPVRHHYPHHQFDIIRKVCSTYTNYHYNLPQTGYKSSSFHRHPGSVVRLLHYEANSDL